MLPGSRRGEVARLAPVFGDVLRRVLARHPAARPAIAALPARRDDMARAAQDWPVPPIVLDAADPQGKRALFAAADVALAKSGTVSLELAAAGTPMVVAYDMNWLTRQILGRMLRIDTVTLVNLVSETRAVPEFLGARCRAELIAPALLRLLEAPDAQRDALELTMERLGRGGPPPGLRAAEAILEGLAEARARS